MFSIPSGNSQTKESVLIEQGVENSKPPGLPPQRPVDRMSRFVFLERAASICRPNANAADLESNTEGCSRGTGKMDTDHADICRQWSPTWKQFFDELEANADPEELE